MPAVDDENVGTLLERSKTALTNAILPPPGEPQNLFAASATVLYIGAVYLYFTGYIYTYFYYSKYFGVTPESLNLTPQCYFIRSYTALHSIPGLLAAVALIAAIALYMSGKLRRILIVFLLILAFPVLAQISMHAAKENYLAEVCNPGSTIRITFKPSAAAGVNDASSAASQGDTITRAKIETLSRTNRLALLLETQNRIVFFEKPGSCFPLGPNALRKAGDQHVFTVLRSDLDYADVIKN